MSGLLVASWYRVACSKIRRTGERIERRYFQEIILACHIIFASRVQRSVVGWSFVERLYRSHSGVVLA
jgi:hypothetical protein